MLNRSEYVVENLGGGVLQRVKRRGMIKRGQKSKPKEILRASNES